MQKIIFRLNKIYHFIFNEKIYRKLNFFWDDLPSRSILIQKVIEHKKFDSYLEIGCANNENFDKIIIKKKTGVDPNSGGNVKMTSDAFFSINKLLFDIIFIDGLHTYKQVKKDINNSLQFLKEGGVIFVHDCLPRSIFEQAVPRCQFRWTGDVWRAFIEIRTLENLDSCVCYADMGLGIIIKRKNSNQLKINLKNFSKIKFKDYFFNYQKYLNIITHKEIIKFIK
jgi:hypothetical protein